MISYTTNILPTDATYYTLDNATISGGLMTLNAGGSATIDIDTTQLTSLTEYFRIALVMFSGTADAYTGGVTVVVKALSSSGQYFSHFCNVVADSDGIYSTELELISETYTSLQVIFRASVACVIATWELDPEAADGDITTEIEGITQSLPRLLYDYNTTTITVEQSEQNVAMIALYLTADTDLQGHFLMNCTASERCTVYLRFMDSQMIELFSPLLFTINAGLSTLTVPHAYLNKLTGTHTFMVTAQVTNGYLTIPVRGVLYTIDGGYLAERLMNPGMDVQDISIMQLASDSSPSEIWAVGIDNDIVIVKKRSYDPSQANITWEAQATLGEGLYAAIEFDGWFTRREGEQCFTLETNELPFVAVVDMDGTLQVYQEDFSADPLTIDTDVTCVSLVRGFKSTDYPEQDQGMILVYIKDSDVYYKQYMYYNEEYQWVTTEQLTTSADIVFAQVHRLNDYRVGIVTQSATENIWYITERTYVGQAVEPEEVSTSVSSKITWITPLTQTEIDEGYTTEATLNSFDNPEEAPTIFTMTWEFAESLSFFNDDDFDTWAATVVCIANDVTLEEGTYTVELSANVITITLDEGVYGVFEVSWTNINLRMNLSNGRYAWPTTYDYSWTIQHTIEHTDGDTIVPIIEGTAAVVTAEQKTITLAFDEDETVLAAYGTGVVSAELINQTTTEQEEEVLLATSGTGTVTAILVGDVPI